MDLNSCNEPSQGGTGWQWTHANVVDVCPGQGHILPGEECAPGVNRTPDTRFRKPLGLSGVPTWQNAVRRGRKSTYLSARQCVSPQAERDTVSTHSTPTGLAPGDLVRFDAPAGFVVGIVRGTRHCGRKVAVTVDLHLAADEEVNVLWADAAPVEEVGA